MAAHMLDESLYERLEREIEGTLPVIRCTKATLLHLSHSLEDIVLRNQLPALIFTGFQESSHWRKEAQRYDQLSQIAHQVCIFAGRPLPPESNASQLHVELYEGDPLRQEWFLGILTDRFSVLLCGQDTQTPVHQEAEREFNTIWTFSPVIIDKTLDVLAEAIRRYRPERYHALQAARQKFPPVVPDSDILTGFTADLIQFEEALNSELRWRQMLIDTMLANISHHVYVLDIMNDGEDIRLMYHSPRFEALIGRPIRGDEDVLDALQSVLHPDDHDDVLNRRFASGDGDVSTLTYRIVRPDETVIWVEDTVTVRSNDHGFTVYGVIQDVTERNALEDARREQHELSVALDKERELNAIKSYFMTTVMHEFRTPLATILSSSELLDRYAERYTTEDRQRRLRNIQGQVLHMTHMLDDIAVIINGDIDRLGFNPEAEDVRALIGDFVGRFRTREGVGHTVTVTYADDLPGTIPLDRRLLKHIINNLLANAVKFSPSASDVALHVEQEDDALVLRVVDQGIGIPADEQDKVFESLYRADNARMIGGTGLGLTIVAQCVAAHQGTIAVESEVDAGTTMTVRLPLDASDPQDVK
jgi:signal transduction histidine kinase/DICT domain-containing protein